MWLFTVLDFHSSLMQSRKWVGETIQLGLQCAFEWIYLTSIAFYKL